MPSTERALDRANRRALQSLRRIGEELRVARRDRDLSQRTVGRACGTSAPTISRIERGLAREVSVLRLTQVAEVVGLDLGVRVFAGGQPVRDAGQLRVLGRLRARVHPSIRWSTEVPLPIPGDQRAWDAMLSGETWRYGAEVETGPIDAQALTRRLRIKARDGGVDGILLVLPPTRRVRAFLAGAGELLTAEFPVAGTVALERLARGEDPGGSAIVLVRDGPGRGE